MVEWFLVTCPWSNLNVFRPRYNCAVVSRWGVQQHVISAWLNLKWRDLQHVFTSLWVLNYESHSQGNVNFNAGAFSGANVIINFYNSKWFCIRYWGCKSILYFFMYFQTFVIKLRLIFNQRDCEFKKKCALCLFVFVIWLFKEQSKYITKHLMYGPEGNQLVLFSFDSGVSREKVEGNIRALGKTKLTVSLGAIH